MQVRELSLIYAAAAGLTFGQPQVQRLLGARSRRNSLSVKRSVSGAVRDTDGSTVPDEVFTDVNRKKKKKEFSTGKATLQTVQGVTMSLQPSYQHFVGNTPGHLEKETLELVFKELAKPVLDDLEIAGPLEIEQCNLLTKEQNTRTRVWRVVVPDKYKAVMQDDRMYPTGWHHREFEGHFRPPLSSQERADRDSKRASGQHNDNRMEALLRHLVGPSKQH